MDDITYKMYVEIKKIRWYPRNEYLFDMLTYTTLDNFIVTHSTHIPECKQSYQDDQTQDQSDLEDA